MVGKEHTGFEFLYSLFLFLNSAISVRTASYLCRLQSGFFIADIQVIGTRDWQSVVIIFLQIQMSYFLHLVLYPRPVLASYFLQSTSYISIWKILASSMILHRVLPPLFFYTRVDFDNFFSCCVHTFLWHINTSLPTCTYIHVCTRTFPIHASCYRHKCIYRVYIACYLAQRKQNYLLVQSRKPKLRAARNSVRVISN